MRKKTNPKGIEKVLAKIQALEADYNANQVTKRKTRDNIRRVGTDNKQRLIVEFVRRDTQEENVVMNVVIVVIKVHTIQTVARKNVHI